MINWKDCINKPTGVERIQDIQSYLKKENDIYKAPIDRFYLEVRKIIGYCTDIQALEDNDFLGPLLYVGIISKTEIILEKLWLNVLESAQYVEKQQRITVFLLAQ